MATGSPKGRAAKPAGKSFQADERLERFCQEYAKDRNGTQAAIRAGIPPKGAAVTASRLLRNAKVISRILEIDAQVQERNQLQVDKLVKETEKLAFSDLGKLLVKVGDRYELRPLEEVDTSILAEIKINTTTRTTKGGEVEVEQVISAKPHSKTAALEMLFKRLGELKELLRVEVGGKGAPGPVCFSMRLDTGSSDE
jgi:phage terminase small subunit